VDQTSDEGSTHFDGMHCLFIRGLPLKIRRSRYSRPYPWRRGRRRLAAMELRVPELPGGPFGSDSSTDAIERCH
jgi:hypothetical protein